MEDEGKALRKSSQESHLNNVNPSRNRARESCSVIPVGHNALCAQVYRYIFSTTASVHDQTFFLEVIALTRGSQTGLCDALVLCFEIARASQAYIQYQHLRILEKPAQTQSMVV